MNQFGEGEKKAKIPSRVQHEKTLKMKNCMSETVGVPKTQGQGNKEKSGWWQIGGHYTPCPPLHYSGQEMKIQGYALNKNKNESTRKPFPMRSFHIFILLSSQELIPSSFPSSKVSHALCIS